MIRAAILALAVASPASADPQCGPYAAVASGLGRVYGEVRIASGLSADATGRVIEYVEVYTNPASGTFTVLRIDAMQVACIIAAGGRFHVAGVDG